MATSGARSDDASALSNETAWVIQRLTAQTGELRAELAGLGVEIRQCGQAYVELLEVAAERLDELVTPARYRR